MPTAAIILIMFVAMLIALGCSEGLTEQEVRQIVQEYPVPGPGGDKGEPVQGHRALRATGAT